MSVEHQLKIDPEMFQAVIRGDKRAEFRRDDRGFQVDDTIVLDSGQQRVLLTITHIVRGPGYGIPEGYAMLSFMIRAGLL